MNANLQDIIRSMNQDSDTGPRFDFSQGHNVDKADDIENVVQALADMASKKWGAVARSHGFANDAQVAAAVSQAAIHTIAGVFTKPPLETNWSGGKFLTITDDGASLGHGEVEWLSQGRRESSIDDGIIAPDQSPERTVGLANQWQKAKLVPVATKFEIGLMETARAQVAGYNVFDVKGRQASDSHLWDINNILRRGNAKYGVHGICNFPGIRHRAALTNWGTADADVIYDDYNGAIDEIFVSDTEDAMPAMSILPRRQYRHISTEQFSPGGTDTTLRAYIEMNNPDHKIFVDAGMKSSSLFDGPGALFMTNRADLVRCVAPVWMNVMPPHEESEFVISVTVMSYIAGVIVTDTDSVLYVDGSSAGWT